MKIPIEISARHIHLHQNDIEALFGKGYKLTPMRALSQRGEFAAEETVEVIGEKNSFPRVRIIGPARPFTQIEISKTDSFFLGVKAALKLSGDIKDTPGITIKGPKGEVKLKEGVIVAKRHLHASPLDLKKLGIENKETISVKTSGDREIIFNNVIARVNPNFNLSLHIDADEANAAGIDKDNNTGEILNNE